MRNLHITEVVSSMCLSRPKQILKDLLSILSGKGTSTRGLRGGGHKTPNTANPDVVISRHLSNVSDKELLELLRNDGSLYFGQSAEDGILSRLFKDKTDGFYVDIGAYNPTRYSNTKIFHRFFNWRGINIDANIDTVNMYDTERPNDININVAIGERKGVQSMAVYRSAAVNTLSKENMIRQKDKGHEVIETREVPTMPLKAILDKYLPKNTHIDLLDIDVEGYDLEALKTNDWKLYRPSVVLIEDYTIATRGFGESDIYKYMISKNYRFFSHAYDTSFYVDNDEFNDEG